MRKWVAAFDSHGDMLDRDAEKVLFDFIDDFKPDVRIHGGDFLDLRSLRTNVGEDERTEDLKADVEAGVDFVQRFAPDVLLMGNHDHRLIKGVRNRGNGNLRMLCQMLHDSILDRIKVKTILPYDAKKGIYRLGDLAIMHGYRIGKYAALQAALQAGSSAMMGHVHTDMEIPLDNAGGHVGHCIGCLCQLDMQYAETWVSRLRWSHGFAFGYENRGTTTVFHATERNGIWNIHQGGK